MPRMVCVKCQTFFHPKKNGVRVEEGRPVGTDWLPYKLWLADSWECLSCGFEVISGFGQHPYAEHYQSEYESRKAERPVRVFVKDCL